MAHLIMSKLLINTLCQTQTARSLTGRLLSTSSVVSNRATPAYEHSILKAADLVHAKKVFQITNLEQPHADSNKLEKLLSNHLLLTNENTRTVKVESTGTETLKDERDKVLSSRDVVVDKENKASLDQLEIVADHLSRHLPHFFQSPHPFHLYSKDLVFINKPRSMRTQGLGTYILQIALVKVYYTLSYTSNRMELLNIVKDPEESCIKIRWRFVSKPGLLRFMLTFYNYHDTVMWKDAISTVYVNKEGKIYCHVCDNIDVEKEGAKVKKIVKNPLINRGINV